MPKQVKLSKTQQRIMDIAKAEIAKARQYASYEDYFVAEKANRCNNLYNTPEKYKARNLEGWEWYEECWKAQTQAIVRITAKVETTKKLEALGLIEIIELNRGYMYDIVRIIE